MSQQRSSDPSPIFVSVQEAAAKLGIGRSLFYEEILGTGLITPVYIGSRVLIAVEDVDELAQQLRAVGDIRVLVKQLREKSA